LHLIHHFFELLVRSIALRFGVLDSLPQGFELILLLIQLLRRKIGFMEYLDSDFF